MLYFIFSANTNTSFKDIKNKMLDLGFDVEKKIVTWKYIAGHPKIDSTGIFTSIIPKDNCFYIFEDKMIEMPNKIGEINCDKIKNIVIEDRTTIEKRVTIGRLLLTGIFAFAWKKSDKNEISYLIIEWADDRFEHETIFEFSGESSYQYANTARNKLISFVNSQKK